MAAADSSSSLHETAIQKYAELLRASTEGEKRAPERFLWPSPMPRSQRLHQQRHGWAVPESQPRPLALNLFRNRLKLKSTLKHGCSNCVKGVTPTFHPCVSRSSFKTKPFPICLARSRQNLSHTYCTIALATPDHRIFPQ
jgi:hypothetical protein